MYRVEAQNTPCQVPHAQRSSSLRLTLLLKQFVFLSIHAFEKRGLGYIYLWASMKIDSSVSCILNIYVSGGILYLSFCNLLFSLNILFLRIIHVDADRKLNIISESENIPAHWRHLAKSTRHFVDVSRNCFTIGCLGCPSVSCRLKIFWHPGW